MIPLRTVYSRLRRSRLGVLVAIVIGAIGGNSILHPENLRSDIFPNILNTTIPHMFTAVFMFILGISYILSIAMCKPKLKRVIIIAIAVVWGIYTYTITVEFMSGTIALSFFLSWGYMGSIYIEAAEGDFKNVD